MGMFSRRKFLTTAGLSTVGAIALNACSSGETPTATTTTDASPAATSTAAPVNAADAPEVTKAKLGFIALTDASPLIIAQEKGYFAKYGMTGVEVLKQASWGTTRDNIVLGSDAGGIDGAHILTPMPYLISEGKITNGKKVPMYILARLNTNGQGISVANNFKDDKIALKSDVLKETFAKQKAAGKELKCAMTFPGGTHDLWIRYWLAANGVDPDKDVSTIVVPPAQMVANMKAGNMEAFCVGEPWNARLVAQDSGYTALITGELWKDHPEKAFSLRADWVDKNPKAAMALLKAVLEAQVWCEDPANKEEMCKIVGADKWLKVPAIEILGRQQGKVDYGDGRTLESTDLSMKFWKDNASYPFKSHDLWFLTEDIRWGYFEATLDSKALVDKVNREDLWKEAAKAIGKEADIPKSTSRGIETFFDGVKFDPENPKAYLEGLKIKKMA
ncbi:CmpA/NrtA family ABC transporter substrate-binding protein [Pseudanabaena galeata UHCC 0370]|jgi:nitrate/nitrite transport system substrate-binding protein|uniref:CmpA/NrtA family ABC transporter substrate-binding protein n=1 Tax=Pseudanabaena galeata UHCC 0370 TaxID=3110310 RepID=A0ABU5TLH0_9CYAN|nr:MULTISPECIES: CmpA/NrtA family ABC transporter substrate-binding protein [Pseudanabaena]MEA5478947.1 CmpA/NrtA family ABC transporter substrate-binding protein [Pseudanabaena galeata UHCC 0370]MEA5485847.1 CmpA/NrtA family ABC transporter substrate-binding protein [Pseudanabaena sp. CCNP1317]WGS72262.1 CmpA/NrtA family ABC transporter substrate-binding protein [Pseudanabaena galeata CCNP1313]